jgi:hypothetical protein
VELACLGHDVGLELFDAAFIHAPFGNQAGGGKVPQPSGGVVIELVVEHGHAAASSSLEGHRTRTMYKPPPLCQAEK